jgi:hypothetical protein
MLLINVATLGATLFISSGIFGMEQEKSFKEIIQEALRKKETQRANRYTALDNAIKNFDIHGVNEQLARILLADNSPLNSQGVLPPFSEIKNNMVNEARKMGGLKPLPKSTYTNPDLAQAVTLIADGDSDKIKEFCQKHDATYEITFNLTQNYFAIGAAHKKAKKIDKEKNNTEIFLKERSSGAKKACDLKYKKYMGFSALVGLLSVGALKPCENKTIGFFGLTLGLAGFAKSLFNWTTQIGYVEYRSRAANYNCQTLESFNNLSSLVTRQKDYLKNYKRRPIQAPKK